MLILVNVIWAPACMANSTCGSVVTLQGAVTHIQKACAAAQSDKGKLDKALRSLLLSFDPSVPAKSRCFLSTRQLTTCSGKHLLHAC